MKYNEIVFVNNGDNSFFARFIINRNEINHSIVEEINILPNKLLENNAYIKQVKTEKIKRVDKDFINDFFKNKIYEADNKDNDLYSLKSNSLIKLNEQLKSKKEELKIYLNNKEETLIIHKQENIYQEIENLSKEIQKISSDMEFIKLAKIGAKNKLNKLRNLLLKEVEIIREEG